MNGHGSGCICVPCCDADALAHNPIHQAERDEYRSELAAMSEVQRAAACGHVNRRGAICPDCGDDIGGEW